MSSQHSPRIERGEGEWQKFLDDKLATLQKLPEGSDSWTAHRPAQDVVQAARLVAQKFVTSVPRSLPNPLVAATSEGGLQLKWIVAGSGEYSLFIYPDQSIEFLFVSDHQEPISGSTEVDKIPELFKLIAK